MKIDLGLLSQKVKIALVAGWKAADAAPDDGGSANLDRVVLYGLKGVREDTLRNCGISCHKGRNAGTFHMSESFGGQGNRRYIGVQAMAESLKAQGIECYVHYQMD